VQRFNLAKDKMNHASLFSGIGGFDLAAEWMGWTNVFNCEIDKFCQKVLKYHFPDAFSVDNIFNLTVDNYGNIIYLCDKEILTMGQKRSNKYDDAVSLYEGGMSIQDCAEFYEISRQAMHKILQRRGCKFRDNLKYGEDNHFHRGFYGDYSKKKRVQHIVEKAIQKGILERPVICSICNNTQVFEDGRNGIQAHHNDYNKPLEITWMCQKCHHEWHKNNHAINTKDEEKEKEPSAGTIDVLSGGFP
jgi:uncharacterized protein YlaI/predicted HTH domain antitoxin